jgi:hypothetical protein
MNAFCGESPLLTTQKQYRRPRRDVNIRKMRRRKSMRLDDQEQSAFRPEQVARAEKTIRPTMGTETPGESRNSGFL